MTRLSPALRSWATRTVPEPAMLAGGITLGILLRAVQMATSIGSVDASNWLSHVLWVNKLGVLRAYEGSRLINHPTLGLEIAFWTWRIGQKVGLQFFDAFRILTSVADIGTALALVAIARRTGANAVWVALVFFLSPASIFISAFHCNSDPLMVMFIVLALLSTVTHRPIAAGWLIGVAIGIKIIAFAALPLMLFALRGWRSRLQFLAASAAVGAVVFIPPVVVGGWTSIRNIFGYTGWSFAWGLRFFLSPRVVMPAFLAALVALWSFEGWRAMKGVPIDPQRLMRASGLAFLIVLFIGPGFAVQYLMWVLPFLAFVVSRGTALLLHGLISAFLFAVYTSWSGEWPWLWANRPHYPPWVGMLGVATWIAIGWATASAARSLSARATR